jgi:hypothetical protein
MSDFNTASVVAQGLITVAGVTLGILLTEVVIRARDRRRAIERNTIQLTILVPQLTIVIATTWDESFARRPDTSLGSEWSRLRDRTNEMLSQVRSDARWPLRRAQQIRAEAEDLIARLAVATFNWMGRGQLISDDELEFILPDLLMKEVFPDVRVVDDAVEFYRENGQKERFAKPPKVSLIKRYVKRLRSWLDARASARGDGRRSGQ